MIGSDHAAVGSHRSGPARAAIATVVIGDRQRAVYERVFRPSVERYVERFGYDLVLVDRSLSPPPLDDPTTISFNKLLVPFQTEVAHYRHLMVLDADVMIGPTAPAFDTLDTGDRIGIVDERGQPSPAEWTAYQRHHGYEETPRYYYALAGIDIETDRVLNGGMFICRPSRHAGFFRALAERRLAEQVGHPRGFHFEQSVFGHALMEADLAHVLPATWNLIWPRHRWSFERASSADLPIRRLDRLAHLDDLTATNACVHLAAGQDHDLAAIIATQRARASSAVEPVRVVGQ